MPVTITHAKLVAAFEYAIAKSAAEGINVVEMAGWRDRYGSSSKRITKLHGMVLHHTGSEIPASGVRAYTKGLGTGSIRPDIGRILCNTSTVRPGGYPGFTNGRSTIVVNGCDYANHAGLGDRRLLDELRDGDVDNQVKEFLPDGDDLYVNQFYWGDEGVGAYRTPQQTTDTLIFYAHAMHFLGLDADTDKDGHFAPIVAHRESTRRKSDPARTAMVAARKEFEAIILKRYPKPPLVPVPVPKPTPPAPVKIRVATFNTWSYAAPSLHKRLAKLVSTILSAKADFVCLTECPSAYRDAIIAELPGKGDRWKVWVREGQAILFDAKRFSYNAKEKLTDSFGPTIFHGFVAARFVEKASGKAVVVGAYHLPPNVVDSKGTLQKRGLVNLISAMRKLNGARVIGGDGMDSGDWVDWTEARTIVGGADKKTPTYKGKAITDRLHSDTKTPVTWIGYGLRDAGSASDHDLVVAEFTL